MSGITKLKAVAFSVVFLLAVSAPLLNAQSTDTPPSGKFKRVLLISVDGLHAVDVARYVSNNPHSALAELARHGSRIPARVRRRTRILSPVFWPS